MPTFAVKIYEQSDWRTKIPVGKLLREGVCLLDEFIQEIKADKNLEPELSDLFAIINYVADCKMPHLRYTKYNLLKISDKLKYAAYEAKSTNLRLYCIHDKETGMVLIIGGKKTTQKEDINRVEKIIKEYTEFKNKK